METRDRASIWRWLPFEMPEGEVRRYLVSHEGFDMAVDALFDMRIGGYDAADETHVDLRRALKMRACDAGDHVAIADEVAELFMRVGVVCSEASNVVCDETGNVEGMPDLSARLPHNAGERDLDVLDLLCAEGGLFPEDIAGKVAPADGAAQEILAKLSQEGLVVAKTDGRYVLTREGMLAWAELKYGGGPVGNMDAMLEITQRWEGAAAGTC